MISACLESPLCPCDECLAGAEAKVAYVVEVPATVARSACERFHYSREMPSGVAHNFGVFEHLSLTGKRQLRYVGSLSFGFPSARISYLPSLKLGPRQLMDLRRIALSEHSRPVSQMMRSAVRLLRRKEPSLELLVSYADPKWGHTGYVYQASNWSYMGLSASGGPQAALVLGEEVHLRTLHHRYGTASVAWIRENVDPGAKAIPRVRKHLYMFAISRRARAAVASRSLPYPKEGDPSRW